MAGFISDLVIGNSIPNKLCCSSYQVEIICPSPREQNKLYRKYSFLKNKPTMFYGIKVLQ